MLTRGQGDKGGRNVQKCKSAYGLCKSAKVKRESGNRKVGGRLKAAAQPLACVSPRELRNLYSVLRNHLRLTPCHRVTMSTCPLFNSAVPTGLQGAGDVAGYGDYGLYPSLFCFGSFLSGW